MAKKNKNSNYVTEKTISAKEKKQQAQSKKIKKAKIMTIVLWVVGCLVAIGLLLGFLALAKQSAENSPTTATVAHDHDGDGVADHDDHAH